MLKQRYLVALMLALLVPGMAFAAAPAFVQGDLGQLNAPLKAADGSLGLSAKAALHLLPSSLKPPLGLVLDFNLLGVELERRGIV